MAGRQIAKDACVHKFRLLDLRRDGSLAIGLIAGTAVVFQRPLRFLLNAAGTVEQQYHLDLLPALVVLSVVFMFHQYRKRQESRATAFAAETAARVERARAAELDELVSVGHSLANALQFKEIEQVLWRNLPGCLRNCRLSVVMQQRSAWRILVHDDADSRVDNAPLIEEVAANAAGRFEPYTSGPVVPIAIEGFLCFPVFANRSLIGAAVVLDGPETRDLRLQQVLAPVLAFVGIAIRNVQLLTESQENSVRDSLTGWFNRRHALEALRSELRRAARSAHPPALLMFDLDDFKAVNDGHGHLHGDAVLQAVARSVDGLLRGSDIKCRYGGDEFLVILPETSITGAAQVAEHIRHAIMSMDLATHTQGPRVTGSIGVTVACRGELEPERLIARADAALYRAKRAGRDRVVVHDGSAEREVQPLRLVASGG
jgi:diguanylate cyclase (GGDEF)-like protein